MDKDKIPKKPKSRKKIPKTEATPTPSPTPAFEYTPLTVEENQLFLNHINAFLQQKQVPKRDKIDDYKVLQNTINEFLESFVVFGYTFSGERVLIQHYPTARDKDAIIEFLKNVFIANSSREVSFLDSEPDPDDE